MTRKLSITDARRVNTAALPGDLLRIAADCDLQALVHFYGDRNWIASPSHWAESEQKARSIANWALGHQYWLNGRAEARDQLGGGCSILLAVQRDGGLHCCTWSPKNADCKGMKGWSDKFMFAPISIVPFRTVFGFTTEGVPTPLTEEERVQVPPAARLNLPKLEGLA